MNLSIFSHISISGGNSGKNTDVINSLPNFRFTSVAKSITLDGLPICLWHRHIIGKMDLNLDLLPSVTSLRASS